MSGRIFKKEVFAERLLELMESNGDTVYSLAEYLHLSPSAISKYTNAKIIPKQVMIEAIALKYGIESKYSNVASILVP